MDELIKEINLTWTKKMCSIEVSTMVALSKCKEIKFESESGFTNMSQQVKDKAFNDMYRIRKELELATKEVNELSEAVRKFMELKNRHEKK